MRPPLPLALAGFLAACDYGPPSFTVHVPELPPLELSATSVAGWSVLGFDDSLLDRRATEFYRRHAPATAFVLALDTRLPPDAVERIDGEVAPEHATFIVLAEVDVDGDGQICPDTDLMPPDGYVVVSSTTTTISFARAPNGPHAACRVFEPAHDG